jgi:hypothetical protein
MGGLQEDIVKSQGVFDNLHDLKFSQPARK